MLVHLPGLRELVLRFEPTQQRQQEPADIVMPGLRGGWDVLGDAVASLPHLSSVEPVGAPLALVNCLPHVRQVTCAQVTRLCLLDDHDLGGLDMLAVLRCSEHHLHGCTVLLALWDTDSAQVICSRKQP